MKTLALTLVLALGVAPAQEPLQSAPKLDQHAWLLQLVGEWSVTSEVHMTPGAEPTVWKSEESVRAIGELWIVIEGTADNDGEPFKSLMTLGYDPAQGAFVGSWIDSLKPRMWTYVGSLDEARRVLTLEAEGPALGDPNQTAKYRDHVELVSPDHKRIVSTMLDADGTWTTYMTMNARRTK